MVEQDITRLMQIIAKLRDPKSGCPWDVIQTHSSLIPYVLEEAYEVTDAIKNGNDNDLQEELGDLLLQVLLHTHIATEEKRFDLRDVVTSLRNKLIRRHPHVFENQEALSIEEVKKQWEKIKEKETPIPKSESPISDKLRNRIRSQSAISGAMIISQKTAKEGFEWENFNDVWDKVIEEMNELKEAIDSKQKTDIKGELGDIIFTLINVARWHELNPEECLSKTNQKFLDRFSWVEKNSTNKISKQSFTELNYLWENAKNKLKAAKNNKNT
ncbi:nucleoside triphosphate pyrophosphohydrolase [Prochlorococcus sp. MIT 1341]|uniref:nucleoside triphosphate pyrophosphohydrolase n=1 Tax=Prochlorococcus sp. MIT 1341 TaxID=3096221 RepID=UPI002A755B23|nr:nucleoside triphosphate pyrophosphohydrolase [Prochlorococcus sp. MIT 1341]